VCSVRRGGAGLTSWGIGLGLSGSDSDLFGVGLASRTSVPLLFSFVRCSSRAKLAWRIIVRLRNRFPAGAPELLFAPDPASQLVSGFGLHNCSVFYPVLSQHVLCEVCMPGLRSELLFAFHPA